MNSRHPSAPYRGRFAPSPTGPLHLGSLYTAVVGFCEARRRGGAWLVRIDDADRQRCRQTHADSILRTLETHGLWWDEAVLFQSLRDEIYRVALERLAAGSRVFPCTCPRRELAGSGPIYSGRCRARYPHPPAGEHALRLRVGDAVIGFDDRLQGRIEQDLGSAVGDFVVRRRDGLPAYHLATVIDDAEQRVTEVLRGVDLLDSTPRQILLQECLGLPRPDYCHIPVLTDRGGIKLSKQAGARPVDEDAPSENLWTVLALLGFVPEPPLIGAKPAEILDWAVAHWDIRRLPPGRRIDVGGLAV
ncbi:glutamyl-tRNA synthetase domain protein [Methylococcus capsulatus str. Bath]|uniref:Glutamyl-Q tRNA(Asp) synthetase n=1 Tax=Methylococcus capsulatus (strain ATCC 33009 / NCIMB 11132 / Bath) TaxID=243233 RepID=GLUQ_METCA|nr:tRNA glutamyl-Q(34) synthetase GluQRS [Methylococcus capsulatus]Q60BF9.1 RecName: Full=Glutamyl-Q tRNA(Asp) synthetase; Short=Glu-Q-RSs [Methylococcus capsulatus str. Bath]AAU93293.1 glutamyl-tRNA synthetase domain protein [Methylococcus capsulatus str. Bath]